MSSSDENICLNIKHFTTLKTKLGQIISGFFKFSFGFEFDIRFSGKLIEGLH